MDTCFECGGKVKLIAKIGRTIFDDNLFYEIPPELKIPTCVECGYLLEDEFTQSKINNAIRSQKEVKPNSRLLQLRWIDDFIKLIFQQPKSFGNRAAVYCQVILLLKFRELLLSKGADDKRKEIIRALKEFIRKKWPKMDTGLVYPKDVLLEDELAPALRVFCNIWINT